MEIKIEIQKKRQPITLIVLFFALLGILAIWVLIRFIYPTLPGFWDLKLSAVGAIAGAVGFGIYSVIKQHKNNTPGLIIDEFGITDQSTLAGVGFIPWSDIIDIKEVKGDFNRTLIVVMVNHPETYINKSSKMRAGKEYEFQKFGSPILISAASLDYPEQQLFTLLQDRVRKSRSA